MKPIAIGTLCYLVGVECFSGFVVEVVSLLKFCEDDHSARHRVDAQWLHEYFGNRDVLVRPQNLRPIADPDALYGEPCSEKASV